MAKIPTGNHIRSMRGPVHPSHLQSSFDQVVAALHARGGLKPFERLGGRTPIALEGTEYFCSSKLGCPNCQTRKRANGKVENYHSIGSRNAIRPGSLWLASTIVAPGHNMAVPLMPEFIAKQDGAEKQDGERVAAKRVAHGARMQALRPVYLGDDLFACQPICEAVLASGGDFLFTAKPGSHKTLDDFMNGAAIDELSIAWKAGANKPAYRYRWFTGAPLREGKGALNVNWIGVTIAEAKGKATYDGAFVANLDVTAANVGAIAACPRARWKIENESFNVLKNNFYNFEHNFGHGKQHLAMTFAAINLLAFAFHSACDSLSALWIKARKAKRASKRFIEQIRTIAAYLGFPSWETLMITLHNSKPPPKSKNKSEPEK